MTSVVSVVAVVRDEPPERLENMFRSLVQQVGLGDGLELVLAAAESDASRQAALQPAGAVTTVRWVPNPGGERSPGLNAAVEAASGCVIVRIDARSAFQPGHVRQCIDLLGDATVGIAGGAQVAVPGGSGAVARGIARALRNPFLSGGAAYRSPDRSGSVDTVYLGAFRRATFDAVGGYEVRLRGNEDFDLCQRVLAHGLSVQLSPELAVEYGARETYGSLARQYWNFGLMKVDYWRLRRLPPKPRQLIVPSGQAAALALLPLMRRRSRLALALCGLGGAALVALDSTSGPAPARVRASSVVAAAVGACSFGAGVWAGVLGTRRS